MWGGSDGEGDGDRGRLKRKGFLVGFEEEEGVVLEESSGAEAMVKEWVGRWLIENVLCHPVFMLQKLLLLAVARRYKAASAIVAWTLKYRLHFQVSTLLFNLHQPPT